MQCEKLNSIQFYCNKHYELILIGDGEGCKPHKKDLNTFSKIHFQSTFQIIDAECEHLN
jgi:hypothetical protein